MPSSFAEFNVLFCRTLPVPATTLRPMLPPVVTLLAIYELLMHLNSAHSAVQSVGFAGIFIVLLVIVQLEVTMLLLLALPLIPTAICVTVDAGTMLRSTVL